MSRWDTLNDENLPLPFARRRAPPPTEGGEQSVPPPMAGEVR